MVTTLTLLTVFMVKGFSLSDTQTTAEFKLGRPQLSDIAEAKAIQLTFEGAKARSCKNNVTGFDIFINDKLCGRIETGEPKLNPKTMTYTLAWLEESGRFKTVQQALKESNKLKLRPVFNDDTTDGCYSFSGRSFKILVEKVE